MAEWWNDGWNGGTAELKNGRMVGRTVVMGWVVILVTEWQNDRMAERRNGGWNG